MTLQIRKPPFDTEMADGIPWGAPKKADTYGTASKSTGNLKASCYCSHTNESGGVASASVGILELGPPKQTTILDVAAHGDVLDAWWYLWADIWSSKTWGKLALEVTSDPAGQSVRSEEVLFDASDRFGTENEHTKKAFMLSVYLRADTEHTYQATVHASVEALAAGEGKHGFGSSAMCGIEAKVNNFWYEFM